MANFTSTLPANNFNVSYTTPDAIGCGPPPGWTGPPPPGIYADIAVWLQRVVIPIFISFGTFGNLITVTILLRQSKAMSTTGMFLMSLAFSDTVLLYTSPLRRWIKSVWEIDIRNNGVIACKTSVYLTYCSIQFSSWILVVVTIERLISVVWPHRVKIGCTRKNTTMIIVIIFVAIFGMNTHIIYGFGHSKLSVHRGLGYCEPQYEGYLKFWTKHYSFIDFAVAFVIPFTVLMVSNTVIILKLNQARKQRRSMSGATKASRASYAKGSNTVTVMLISLGAVFFICMAPVSIYFIYSPYWDELNEEWVCTNVYEYFRLAERKQCIFVIVLILGYGNASVNFILYVASGSKFRSQIMALFCCRQVHPDPIFGSRSTVNSRQRFTVYSEISSVERRSGLSNMRDEIIMSVDGPTHQAKTEEPINDEPLCLDKKY